jgi:hypothetical protein
MDELVNLNNLAKKYQEEVTSLKGQMDEASRKLRVVLETIKLLKDENGDGQEELFQEPKVISDKYKDMTLSGAIEDVLRSNKPEKLSATFIHSELVRYGYRSDSKNLQRDVYTRLNKMEGKEKISSTKRGKGKKKYFLRNDSESSRPTQGTSLHPDLAA